jgi:two-component system, LuxR family, response regulator FixJ
VHKLTAREVNAFLREISGTNISLKDFRTLLASASVLESLARIKPAMSSRLRRQRLQERVQDVHSRFKQLTPREVEVFDLVIEGYTSEAIGERLEISTRTVEGYRAQIMDKMQAESVAGLVRQAIRLDRLAP